MESLRIVMRTPRVDVIAGGEDVLVRIEFVLHQMFAVVSVEPLQIPDRGEFQERPGQHEEDAGKQDLLPPREFEGRVIRADHLAPPKDIFESFKETTSTLCIDRGRRS